MPELKPTEAELEQIKEAFAQFQADVADRPDTLAVTRQETVCEMVEVETAQAGKGGGRGGPGGSGKPGGGSGGGSKGGGSG